MEVVTKMRITTGMEGLDERLGGGLPSGSLALLLSNSETCLRLFCQQVCYQQARQKRKVFYFSLLRDPDYVREEMSLYKWDVSEVEREGLWKFIDAYTPRINGLLLKGVDAIASNVAVLVRSSILQELAKGDILAIDSLSDLLLTHEKLFVIELMEILSAKMRETGGLAFLVMVKELHDANIIATLSYLSDILIEFAVDERQMEGKMIFRKMRRAQFEPLFLPLSITDRGILPETFTRVV